MTKIVKGVLSIVKGLPERDRKDLIRGMISSGVLSEDDRDIAVIESRRRGKKKPLAGVIRKLQQEGRLD
jgi:hypothetical protein